ncbi:931_t:CDS:2, partial [Funneliformis geosporum]
SIAFAKSLTSESVVGSIKSNNNNDLLNYDIEMPFLFNNDNFEKANINTSTSIFNLESIMLESTYGDEYFIKNATNASKSLSACPILDVINSSIQYCSNHLERQRPLFQLI